MGLQVSLLSSPVARFLVSERGDLNGSLDDDIRCTDILSFGLRSKVALDAYSDGLSDWRGACCREDAVFSRTPNWVKRDFAEHVRTARSLLLGWSDPRFTLATEPCAKVGSLQPNTVFCPRPN